MCVQSGLSRSSYLTQLRFGHETRPWPSVERPAGCLAEQLSVSWLPFQPSQVQEPPAEQRRGSKQEKTELKEMKLVP